MLFARPCTLLHLLFSVAPHIICFPSLSLTTIMSTFAGYNYEPESLPSEDDGDAASSSRLSKRGTRACDRCRKIKSKCEPTDGEKCKNCLAAGTPCTYEGPNFKRGPPKGYIHAIEQRWQQVECILGALMTAPRAQNVVAELRGDPFARAVLDRVDAGPYGPSGRAREKATTSDNFYATIMGAPDPAARDDRRTRRQSRMTREIVSIEDASMLGAPTREWQDQLVRRLAGSHVPGYSSPLARYSPVPEAPGTSPAAQASAYPGDSQQPRRRRRLDVSYVPDPAPAPYLWDEMPAASDDSYSNPDEVDDAVDSFGHLALDDHREIRYHGHASGLPLLARSERSNDDQTSGGLWKFTAPKREPSEAPLELAPSEDDAGVVLPPPEVQSYLVALYFTYVHPFFPLVHKPHFLANFPMCVPPSPFRTYAGLTATPYILHSAAENRRTHRSEEQVFGGPTSAVEREPMQKVSALLLLAMFAVAARYADGARFSEGAGGGEEPWDAGHACAVSARTILNSIYQFSRPSTVQALLLLGIREFGMGSMEQGWLYSGMALRMALDLGLNRNADNWTEHGQPLFSPVEKQTRKQIWWCCCITDKLSAMWMGRPITFRANDYSTLRPDVVEEEEYDTWQPYPPDALGSDFLPTPSMVMSCFREQCTLSAIITDIMDQIYPVRSLRQEIPRRTLLQRLEERLHTWLFSLPDHLRYSATSSLVTPLPHILVLHIEYCAAVLLLHRAFLPHWDSSKLQSDPLPLKSFDICQSAASHISSMVTVYHEKYGLDRSPPFLSIYLQSAGIMHIITLTRRPQNPQATIGLGQCITALQYMEGIWPGATRVRTLLAGAHVQVDQTTVSDMNPPLRSKRSADEALGSEKNSDILERQAFGRHPPFQESQGVSVGQGSNLDEDINARIMVHTLGLDVPGVEPSTSFYPGYQWWPRANIGENLPQETLPAGTPMDLSGAGTSTSGPLGVPSNQPFTFDQQQLSSDFVQGVHYPILDPSDLFPANPPA
ncbi:hypothetical protein AcV7_000982 [Taiwanofungus camphoratus]|nr:hypothetical protein AcV7_000982 [Antrodia cinnamomea]